jgi:hypothetical protein
MKENRMKTASTDEVSPLPAQATPWCLKIGGDEAIVTKPLHFAAGIWFAIPSDGRTITKMTGKAQFES